MRIKYESETFREHKGRHCRLVIARRGARDCRRCLSLSGPAGALDGVLLRCNRADETPEVAIDIAADAAAERERETSHAALSPSRAYIASVGEPPVYLRCFVSYFFSFVQLGEISTVGLSLLLEES